MKKKKSASSAKKKSKLRLLLVACAAIIGLAIVSAYPGYLLGEHLFNSYFEKWGTRLVELEKRGLLSKKVGAAWQDVLKDDAMERAAGKLLGADTVHADTAMVVDGVAIDEYPSLSIIARLNAVQNYSNEILITDRLDRDIARIRTNHTRGKISEFPKALVTALVAAEDGTFFTNKTGVEYTSIVRSVLGGAVHSIMTLHPSSPRGTSTITQQVAKLFISDVDEAGRRHARKTIDRKLREMRLAAALRKMYSPEEILEVYVNHCITSDNGLIGCKDIARALFDKDLSELSDAQCVYLARSVKWGRNVKSKIARQCSLDMPRIGKAMHWSGDKQRKVLDEIRNLTFNRLRTIDTDFGPLVDCANEFWQNVLRKNGATEAQCADMNIVDPSSLIRKKGNLTIRLAIDRGLQQELESLVKSRGYGPDTVVDIGGKPILIPGQYFAYSIMDSKTGKLLAYFSRDKIGSRLSGLLRYRTPNGSSTAKPLFNALMFDLGVFPAYAKWTDSIEIAADVPWRRIYKRENGKATGVLFANSAVRGRAYEVHNHGDVLEGCQYVFDQLNLSNNILAVETVYRLNRKLFNLDGSITKEAFPLVQFFYRIGAFDRIKDELGLSSVTGVRAYKELARIVGAQVDSMQSGSRRIAISDSLYSMALGTLELTLYEQMHLFNTLYNNDLIEKPAEHPSLAIENIILNGDTVAIQDTVRKFHPFADRANIRPTLLGLHKRLTGTDGLDVYDIAAGGPDSQAQELKNDFDNTVLPLENGASNFAKSGTTDDVITPFNATHGSKRKTNYGVWNAVVRVDMSRFGDTLASDIRDVTVACIGECNEKRTGARDGKTLHKYVTKALLNNAGIPMPGGYFTRYEAYIKHVSVKNADCGATAEEGVPKPGNPFEQLLNIFKKKPAPADSAAYNNVGGVSRNQD